MKSQKLLKSSLFSILFIILFFSCRDDKDRNICEGINPASAEFSVGDEIKQSSWAFGDTILIFDSDTVSIPFVLFHANEDADSYAWQIGDDPRIFKQKSFELMFDVSWHETSISVSLVTTKMEPDCLTEIESTDSISRNIFLFNGSQGPSYLDKMFTKWHGSTNEFPGEEFTIEMLNNYMLFNFPNNCNDYHDAVGGYDDFFVSTTSHCGYFYGNGKISPSGETLVFDYNISYDEGETVNAYTYIGKRVE